MKYLASVLLSACLVVSSVSGLGAQQDVARRHVERGLKLASAGDTLLAFAEFEKAVSAAPGLADAHFYLGRLYTRRANAVETDLEDRKKAEKALLKALRLRPTNPRYLLELGRLRLKQHMRPDAFRLFQRALDRAEEAGDPEALAEVHFNLGYMKEAAYMGLKNRRFRPFFRGPPTSRLNRMTDRRQDRYLNDYLDDNPEIDGSGSLHRSQMLEHYRATLQYDPGHVGAATRLMGYLLDEYRIGEYLAIARRLQEAHPDRPEPLLYRGLGLHAAGRENEAAEYFQKALDRLPDEHVAAIENLAPVMRREDARRYAEMDEEAREAYNEQYWRLSDPLYLTTANERRLEHIARVAYSDLRFAAPSAGERGWETDRGVIYIRYGPPEEIGLFSPETYQRGDPFAVGFRSIIWSYGNQGPVFVFRQTPGYLDARFAGDYRFAANNYRHVNPAKYDNIPSIPEMLEIPVQIARFRGDSAKEVAVEIHASLPIDSLARDLDVEDGELETGLFVLNPMGEVITEDRDSRVLKYEDAPAYNDLRDWRVRLPPGGPLVAAVEARDAISWRSASARDTFTAEAFPDDSLSISDILVADVLRPTTEDPDSRDDFYIAANPALEFESGESVNIYYELYGLGQDDEGFASYDVALAVRIKELERGGGIAQVLGGLADTWGFSVVGDDRLELRFSREVDMADRDRVVEFLSLDPEEAPAGEYEIRLRVWDRLNETLVSRHRSFRVVEPEDE